MTFSGPVLIASTGLDVGLGHKMRCAALAEFNPRSSVVDLETGGELPETLSGALVILDTLNAGNLGNTLRYVRELKDRNCAVAIIDSMPPDHFRPVGHNGPNPDWLVTPYLGAENLRPPPDAGAWLAGPRYAILPPAFLNARSAEDVSQADRILIACGGSDPTGLSLRIAEALEETQIPVDIIVGPHFSPALAAELQAFSEAHSAFRLTVEPDDILSLYLSARLVVGRPGLVRYEAAALGRPAVFLSEINRYQDYFRNFADAGLAEMHFSTDPAGEQSFFARLGDIARCGSEAMPTFPNTGAMATIDACGAKRVWEALDAHEG